MALAAPLGGLLVASCIVWTRTSAPPLYPAEWPVAETEARCPDLSGRYRATSDAAGPLVYRRGDAPRDVMLGIPIGAPHPSPPLGTRLLPWHLAGAFSRDSVLWQSLASFADSLSAAGATKTSEGAGGWVEIIDGSAGIIEVRLGLGDSVWLGIRLQRGDPGGGIAAYRSQSYGCRRGGIAIVGAFPPPTEENPLNASGTSVAEFTFHRAVDGSLIALEDPTGGVADGTTAFKKWWRWRQVGARGEPPAIP